MYKNNFKKYFLKSMRTYQGNFREIHEYTWYLRKIWIHFETDGAFFRKDLKKNLVPYVQFQADFAKNVQKFQVMLSKLNKNFKFS